MGFLTCVYAIQNSSGARADAPNPVTGEYLPVFLRFGSTCTVSSSIDGSKAIVTVEANPAGTYLPSTADITVTAPITKTGTLATGLTIGFSGDLGNGTFSGAVYKQADAAEGHAPATVFTGSSTVESDRDGGDMIFKITSAGIGGSPGTIRFHDDEDAEIGSITVPGYLDMAGGISSASVESGPIVATSAYTGYIGLPQYTVAQLLAGTPSAEVAGRLVWVTDDATGAQVACSAGASAGDWRRGVTAAGLVVSAS
jgi:hypothetical protein